jgi:class 3 adenylate cyclase
VTVDPPEVRYCTTDDGVTIAYAVSGSGPPLVYLDPSPSHLTLTWQFDQEDGAPGLYAWVGARFTFVRLDFRGTGLSQRGVVSLGRTGVADIEAVVRKLGLDRFVLLAVATATRFAIEYAATHPDAVERLVLWNPYAATSDISDQRITGLLSLVDSDWEMFTETYASLIGGWEVGGLSHRYAALLRESITQEDWKQAIVATGDDDTSEFLPLIAAPTLVVSQPQSPVPLEASRKVAAAIPNSRFQIVEGKSVFVRYDSPTVEPWLDAFLRGDDSAPRGSSSSAGSSTGLRTVLFTDLVGHAEMMQRLGDAKGRDVLREHERVTRETLKEYGGVEVKTMGDGFMASFGSVTKAMDCAIALQRAFAAHPGEALHVRVGLNAGEPIEEDGDLFGSTVILASRIAAQAGADEILIPDPLRHLLSGKSYEYADRGEVALKGFDDAVRLMRSAGATRHSALCGGSMPDRTYTCPRQTPQNER